MVGARPVEIAAVVLGLINVALIIRRTVWNYPFGLAMVVLYAWIFYDYRLYSEALLQVPPEVTVHTSSPAVDLLYALYFYLT